MFRALATGGLILLLGGCASYGVVQNAPGPVEKDASSYSIGTFQERWKVDENALMLAFSGGGTRAAALAYGVLKELRDTPVPSAGSDKRMLDEIHSISSVSGGSFTAAYYGLHGEGIFDDFEDVFLRQDVEGALLRRVLNPFSWFNRTGEPLSRNCALTDSAASWWSGKLDCRMIGISECISWTRLASSTPASRCSVPRHGNSMSEITPRMCSS